MVIFLLSPLFHSLQPQMYSKVGLFSELGIISTLSQWLERIEICTRVAFRLVHHYFHVAHCLLTTVSRRKKKERKYWKMNRIAMINKILKIILPIAVDKFSHFSYIQQWVNISKEKIKIK